MLPEQNMEENKQENTNLGQGGYIQYVEARLNNRLLLLSNPDLMYELGLKKEGVIAEAKKLVDISNCIDISTFVEGKQYRSSVELRTAHSELWEYFFKKKNGVLPSNADEEFIKWIEGYIKTYYYMLPGETALDADLRRIAFRKDHSYQWKYFCEECEEYGYSLYGSDKKFEGYVKKIEEESRLKKEAEERERAQRAANYEAFAKSRGFATYDDYVADKNAETRNTSFGM